MNPDRLAELEEERRFLLNSLTDLERERGAGDVEDDDYHSLCDGYTARAATVLRAIQDGQSPSVLSTPREWKRVASLVIMVLVVAVGAGWFVARSSGQRLPGDTLSGGTSPNQVAVLLSEARLLLSSDASAASDRYLAVLSIEPDNPEARTYQAWLLAISSRVQNTADAAATITVAKAALIRAIEVDPDFADPYCFLAVIAADFEHDDAAARVRAQECLDHDPPADMRGLILDFVGDLQTTVAVTTGETLPTTSG